MEKLIAELRRLYLPDSRHPSTTALEEHLRADTTLAIDLATPDGMTRALVLDFPKAAGDQHWLRLCDVGNALQQDLKLPAPAVSVNGGEHYSLWLSLEQPIPVAQMRQFQALLHKAYFEDSEHELGRTVVELPPCLHRATGLWAAFINPAMGASLAEDLGLEMPPPISAQAAFIDDLTSITPEDFSRVFKQLQDQVEQSPAAVPPLAQAPAPVPRASQAGLSLSEATLEDIINELHRRNIEPTLRHLLPR